MHFIYIIQNNINLKLYVGQSKKPNDRWLQHKRVAHHIINGTCTKNYIPQYINKAMAKHGIFNFSFNIIESFQTQNEVNEAEIFWISFFNSQNRHIGYNIMPGGSASGWIVSSDVKIKLSKALKGRRLSPESEFKPGHKFSKETIIKISQSKMGFPSWNKGMRGMIKSPNAGFQMGHTPWLKGTHITTSSSFKNGSKHPNAMLNEQDVLEIIDLNNQQLSIQHIADKFNVKWYTIYSILKGRTWSHITNIIYTPKSIIRIELNERQVLEIINLQKEGISTLEISNRFKTKPYSINRILNGLTWGHVTGIIHHTKINK